MLIFDSRLDVNPRIRRAVYVGYGVSDDSDVVLQREFDLVERDLLQPYELRICIVSPRSVEVRVIDDRVSEIELIDSGFVQEPA